VSRGRGRATPWNRPWCVLDEEREKREKEKEKENSGKLGGGGRYFGGIFWVSGADMTPNLRRSWGYGPEGFLVSGDCQG
jgi:hypothetical protein